MWWWTDQFYQLPGASQLSRDEWGFLPKGFRAVYLLVQLHLRSSNAILDTKLSSPEPASSPAAFEVRCWSTLRYGTAVICSAAPHSVVHDMSVLRAVNPQCAHIRVWWFLWASHSNYFKNTHGIIFFLFFPIAYILVKRKTLWHLFGHRLAPHIQTYRAIPMVVCIFFLRHPGPWDGCRSSYKSLLY